jgi:hypothetical protein
MLVFFSWENNHKNWIYYIFENVSYKAVFRIRIRIRIQIQRIHVFFGLPDPDPLVKGMDPDPDPSIIMQKF